MNCFIDTSALLAVFDRDDEFHEKAVATWRRLIGEEWRMITSSYTLLETLALFQKRLGLKAVRTLQIDVVPLLDVIWVTKALHDAAVTALLATERRKRSLVDCTGFEVMRSGSLTRAFTFDRHFADQGFELLP
mgnify:CR=1 FL=1